MTHTTSSDSSASLRSTWLGLLGAPITWTLYFLGGYALVEAACKTTWLDSVNQGLSSISLAVVILTGVAVVIMLISGGLSFRQWQEAKLDQGTDASDPSTSVKGYMALIGVLLSGFFSLVTLMTGMAVFFISPC